MNKLQAHGLTLSSPLENQKHASIHTENEMCSKFEEAALHIIIPRTLNQGWFRKSLPVSEEIVQLGKLVDELQKVYKDYFEVVINREPWTERNCMTDFKIILEDVLPEDEEKLNWTRIAMFLALAIKVAQHLHKNGASEKFVKHFARCIGGIIEDRVNTWEPKGDRWAALRTTPKEVENSGNGLKLLLGAGVSVVSLFTTIASFGSVSPFFLDKLKN